MKSFKTKHSDPVISLLAVHPTETMRMLTVMRFQGFPSWHREGNNRLETVQCSGSRALTEPGPPQDAIAALQLGAEGPVSGGGKMLPSETPRPGHCHSIFHKSTFYVFPVWENRPERHVPRSQHSPILGDGILFSLSSFLHFLIFIPGCLLLV